MAPASTLAVASTLFISLTLTLTLNFSPISTPNSSPSPIPNPHQAEKYLIDSGRPYTICHPGGLLNSNPSPSPRPNPNPNLNPNPNPNPYQAAYSTSLVASGSWSTPKP